MLSRNFKFVELVKLISTFETLFRYNCIEIMHRKLSILGSTIDNLKDILSFGHTYLWDQISITRKMNISMGIYKIQLSVCRNDRVKNGPNFANVIQELVTAAFNEIVIFFSNSPKIEAFWQEIGEKISTFQK